MKIIKKSKKGFTIVELVIVIAVIAVLAAVLIPTFISLTAKANKASDESLVNSLNKALAIEEVDHEVNNMHDAVEGLKREGYLASTLISKSDQKLLYSLDDNRFLLEGDKKSGVPDYKYWTIQDSFDSSKQTYSIYASDDFSTEDVTGLKVGFDAGDASNIRSISYIGNGTTDQTVVIRTNNVDSSLSVNAPLDTVYHYDVLDELNITAVANASYHEFGKVRGKASIADGHISVEKGAVVPAVEVKNVPSGKTVKVTANEGTIINVASDSAAATTVVANQTGVFVDGLAADKISGSSASSVKMPVLVSNETQLRENANGFAKLGADFSVNTNNSINISGKAVLDLNGHTVSLGDDVADETQLYTIVKGGRLTVNGSGRINGHARIFYNEGELRVDGGTFVTNVLANTGAERSTIISKDSSDTIINAGDFYTAKCNIWSSGNTTINGGTFTSVANENYSKSAYSNCTDCYAYAVILAGNSDINGGEFYGAFGGISHQGGKMVINNVKSEVSNLAFERYATVQETIHYLGHRDDTVTVTASTTTPANKKYYALYAAGENFTVNCTVNGGYFKTMSDKVAALIGNSTYGDGGNRLPAFVSINGGKFEANTSTTVIKVNKYVGTAQISGGNFNKQKIDAAGTVMNLSDAALVLADGYKVVAEQDGTWSVVKK